MKKVITYGTFDLLHYGHICLLRRAKELGDYLIVGITADSFDKARGKINVRQTLAERMEEVRAVGIADQIIVEEYEGQKIDDIRRYGIDIFTVGSDWAGKFDYLSKYCEVVYLDRTEGVSSSYERAAKRRVCLGLIGEAACLDKICTESRYINGLSIAGIYAGDQSLQVPGTQQRNRTKRCGLDYFLEKTDAVYIASHPSMHYAHIKQALEKNRHVLCEPPVALRAFEFDELTRLAYRKGLVFMDAIKTSYATAYNRMLLLIKSGAIGHVVSVDATCTSMQEMLQKNSVQQSKMWNSICGWGPTALLPVLQILGSGYREKTIVSLPDEHCAGFDLFTKIDFIYEHAVATVKAAKGMKSEGELVVSGTKGYIYVPAPWWKTDYFELRFEDPAKNRRYFYQLEGEGIRQELLAFCKAIEKRGYKDTGFVERNVSREICAIVEECQEGNQVKKIRIAQEEVGKDELQTGSDDKGSKK